jgi:hypothetical protein
MLSKPTLALDMADANCVPPSVPKECVDCKNLGEGLSRLYHMQHVRYASTLVQD